MKRILIALTAVFAMGTLGSFHNHKDCEGIVPDNDLFIPINNFENTGITEEQFNLVLDKVDVHYSPIFKAQGAVFTIHRKWSDGTVNAYARRSGNNWQIDMFGGLARHETITEDGFLLVACHEVGHHIGGAPLKSGHWATAEGQSDFFGTMNCFKRVLESEDNVAVVEEMTIDEHAEMLCAETYADDNLAAICMRASMAGKSLAELFRALRRQVSPVAFTTPDPKVSRRTDTSHPEPQCRMDTYFQGALCVMGKDSTLDNDNPFTGNCNRQDGFENGVRPLCWFSPGDFQLRLGSN